jgi:DNA-binding response OmpR family regulator
MEILILTDDPEFDSVMPPVALLTPPARYGPLTSAPPALAPTVEVAIVDARTNLLAARNICRRLAAVSPEIGLVAVVANGDLVAVDMDWGIDELVLPTVGPAELHTRLRLAISRRRGHSEKPASTVIQLGDLLLDEASYSVFAGERRIDLTLTEFKLLNYLGRHPGRAFTRDHLLREVWGHGCGHTKTVDVHVQRLRAKLGRPYESLVDTVRGVGYMAVQPRQLRSTAGGRWRTIVRPRDTGSAGPEARRRITPGITGAGRVVPRSTG